VMGLFGPQFATGALVMVLLLCVELVSSQASLAEAALVYAKPRLNLSLGLGAVAVQVALSLALVPALLAVGAAVALLAATLLLAVAKAALLGRHLGASVVTWRGSLLAAAIPAIAVGMAARLLPEWAMLAMGVPAILLVFGAVLWRFGFRPADRALFARARR
jgi:O-antigen/teichoic acid export membrane protein